MSIPLDFEEAREHMAWEPVFRGMRVCMRAMREAERQERERIHVRWQRHWRTRLAVRLRAYASRLDLPEPSLDR
jgi:hypothetical protein